jgi:dipeptidyl aminopeptidase/acylaminoacyl peptidase
MYTLRTKFKNEILAEFLPPARQTKTQKVIIICFGAPSLPDPQERIEFFSKKGFWTFAIRYRGSWESSGKFLAKSPEQDVLDVIEELPKGFSEAWGNKKFKLKPDKVFVIGSSFGGTAAVLSSLSGKVDKAVAVSPMMDWKNPGPEEPYPKMIRFFKEGFGEGYRLAPNAWQKLQSGKFYNPINHVDKINSEKLLIIHAKDDQTCPYKITKLFADQSGSKLITLNNGGHLSSSILMKPRFQKIFKQFISNK